MYDTYFFFSLSSRVPTLCLFISALSLMGFLWIVAYTVWPAAVLAACFFVGVIMSLQFLVYFTHKAAQRGMAGVQRVRKLTIS